MIASAFGGYPGTVIGGVPPMGFTGQYAGQLPYGTNYDVDPITPGIQTTPGTLTATGPSVVVGGAPFSGLRASGLIANNVMASGYRGVGIPGVNTTFGATLGGVIDADPITPGIQSQPGIVTPTGPPRLVGGPAFGGVGGAVSGAFGGNVLTSTVGPMGGVGTFGGATTLGGLTNVSTFGGVSTLAGNGLIGGIDADPITPGIQAGPGTVTQVGPSRVVGNTGLASSTFNNNLSNVYPTPGYRNCTCCPWWLSTILGLLLLTAVVGGLYAYYGEKHKKSKRRMRAADE